MCGSLVPAALEEECEEGGVAETRGKPGNDGILLAEGNKIFYAEDAAHSTSVCGLLEPRGWRNRISGQGALMSHRCATSSPWCAHPSCTIHILSSPLSLMVGPSSHSSLPPPCSCSGGYISHW